MSVETVGGESDRKGAHHVGADHVGAVACDAPARKVETVLGLHLCRHASRADIVPKSRRIGEGGARIAADQVEPGKRPSREILGFEIVGRNLVGDGR